MIGRWRKGRSDHALGHHAGGALEPWPGVGQMHFPIGAVEFFGILGMGIEHEQMSGHETLLSGMWATAARGFMRSMRGIVGYEIRTAARAAVCGRAETN